MCFKSLTLLGLISLVALTGAKLRWKCELFDTSQETSTRTTFVEFVHGKPPEPSITDPNDPQNPRPPRSTPKCRPRPKNGTIPQRTQTEKLTVQKNRSLIQSDVPGSSFSGGDETPNIKYQRKETHQSSDLNVGPGFEESNDPYGKSKMPVPKRFRPAELKGADELDKPLAEHLDENVMPDFEFDDDDVPPVAEDLPWCPEETEVDCETADLDKLSISELVELKQRCESKVSAERFELIEKVIRTEENRGVEGAPTKTVVAPPTGNTNCSTSPSELSEATLKKFREECPCEDDTSKMSEEEFEVFKKECLDPINGPGKPYLRKNGRCGASQKTTDAMSEKEYKLFVKECLVQPNNITLEKILIVNNTPECTDVKMKGISKSEFSEFKKNCVTSKTCDDVDKSRLSEKELIQFKKMCSPVTRKTNNICEETDVDGLDKEQFDRYMKECFLREEKNDCESVDVDSLSESEYEKYKERCQENPIDCENADRKELRGIEYKMYQKECLGSDSQPPRVVPPIDCGKTNPETLNKRDYEEYDSLCLEPMNCKTTNPDELTDQEYKRYQKKCLQKSASECAKINPNELTDEEYKKYEEECLEKEVNCTTADSREMTKEQYRRFEKVCLKSKSDCKDVDMKKLNDEDYEQFRKDCLKNPPKYDCIDVNVDVLTEEEYQEYKSECLVKDLDCESIDQRKLIGKKLKKFQRECVKKTDDCTDVKVEDLTDEEYESYVKKCLKERTSFDCETTDSRKLTRKQFKQFGKECIKSTSDCKDINPEDLSDEEYTKYLRNCLKKSSNYNCSTINRDDLRGDELAKYQRECFVEEEFDCKSVKPEELSKAEYKLFLRRCVKNTDDCRNVKVKELTDEQYEKYSLNCLKSGSRSECLDVNPKELNEKEYSKYKKDCLDEEGNLNCDSIQSKKLTKTQFEQYEKKCLERKSSGNCNTINPDELSDEEYENYKKNCLRNKPRFSCEDVNVDELNREEYQKYQKECSNKARRPDCDNIRPEELNDKEYAKYKRDCLDSPTSTSDCENARISEMSEKQLQEYEEECLPKNRLSKDCDNMNPKKLLDEEYEKYKRACLPGSSSDCDNVDINELTDEEFSKYKKKCSKRPSSPTGPSASGENVEIKKTVEINTPGGGVSPDCERINPNDLRGSEFEDYQSRCAPGDKSVTITKRVIINNGTGGHEYSVVPPPDRTIDNEGCEDIDVEKMTTYEYNVYKKYCKKNFEGEDCDEIRADKLSDEKLRKYVDICGLFCGIDRKEVLSKEQRRVFEERCEGDSRELEKDCKDVAIENLGEINYGAFAEKCIEQINACSMLKSRRLVRKVYNEYRLKCKPRLHLPENPRCENVDTENMALEEYRDYQKRCGKNRKNDCENVDVEELSGKEYSAYKERCEISRRNENCKDINVDELSREEYKKYLKKCGRTPSTETSVDEDCSDDVSELSHKEFLSRTGRCDFTPDSIQKYCENINWKSVKRDAVKREMTYQGLKEQCPDEPSKDKMTPGNGKNNNCSNVNIEKLTKEEYLQYKKDCGSRIKTVRSGCDDVDVERLSDEEYRAFMKKCGSPRDGPDYPDRPNRKGCSDVRIEELTSEEYAGYKKRCMEPRTPRGHTSEYPDEDCANIDASKLSPTEYAEYRRSCKPRRKTPDCSMKDVSQLSDEEYRIYQKECESEEVPGRRKGCEKVQLRDLSNDEYADYIKRCGDVSGGGVPGESVKITKTVIINGPPKDGSIVDRPPRGPERKTPRQGCDDVIVDQLTKEDYLIYKRRCGEEQPGEPSVIIQKTVKIHENPPKDRYVPPGGVSPGKPHNFDDCSNVNIAKLADDEYNEYRRLCKPTRKRSKPECEDVDVESLSKEELKEHDKNCPPTEYEEVPPPSEVDCSDIDVEELDKDDFIDYKKRCGSPDHPPGSPDDKTIENCYNVKVEDLTSEEYTEYKKRCLKNVIPRRSSVPDENCSRVKIDELTEKEYRAYLRRCPEPENVKIEKTVAISKGCQNRNTDRMTKEEYQQYERECSRNPHIQLEKTVKIIETPREPKEDDDCLDVDTSRMNGGELAEYQMRCGFHETFQFNCNADVTRMSEEEFVKFRRACGRKPFDCDSTDVNSLSDKDYSRYLKECVKKIEIDCDNAKVERMNADEYSEYKQKCKTITRKTNNDCDDVKVETLSTEEYEEYKERCKPRPSPESSTPPTKLRRRVDCSIVDESMMSEEEYADFKNHCNVKVRTDRYRPGENIILTKQVKIRTGKEKFSCYDQDVDNMSDEEYTEFEKKCLSNPHFRFDCRTVDTRELSREEYAKYQRECQKAIVLEKKLIINKTNEAVKDGCYDRDVNVMTDEEYGRYEVKCLGREPTPIQPKMERKTSFDCHNVDLSKLSYEEIEEHIKRCRTRETASSLPPPPRRRQSLKCSDVKTDDLDEEAYAKWVRECLETTPKVIELEKKLIINSTTPLFSGGETVIVEKYEIHEHLRPDDDEGYLEGNENFGVRVLTGIRKRVIKGRPDIDSESENGVILVKKVIHRIPGRRRPTDITDNNDEAGVIEVKRMIMKTSIPEPEIDDSGDIEEIIRRPPRKVDSREEVVLLSVTKRNPHSYRKKSVPEDEEPTEIVKLTKNTRHPNATLREVRIRKHFGTDVAEEAIVQEIGGPDFKITRKTVMIPHRVRKLKPTTTTTTTPAVPEYYYEEEEVPEVITLVKVEKSSRPLRKYSRPADEDDEYVDVKENKPKSYIEFEGYVKVHNTPRKIRKRTVFTDSGEEPDIREVTRKVSQGVEEDDFKGVKVRTHVKKLILIRKVIPEEVPDDEHEVTVVKKLKVLKFGNEEKEHFDENENVHDDGKIIVKNRKFMLEERGKRPGEEEEDEEHVEGRIAVRGRAPKAFRWSHTPERKGSKTPSVTEKNSEFYKIGGSEEDDWERRRKRREEELHPRAMEEEEDGGWRRRKRPGRFEEESEEYGNRRKSNKPRYEESEEVGKKKGNRLAGEDVIIKKLYRIGHSAPSYPDNQKESVILSKKKVLKYGSEREEIPDENDENEEIRLMKRKKLHFGLDRERKSFKNGDDGNDGEMVKVTKKQVYRIGSDGKRELVGGEDVPRNERKSSRNEGDDEEIKLMKRKKLYRIGSDGKRERLLRTGGDEPTDGEMVKISKKKVYRFGSDGERELVDGNERNSSRPIASDSPYDNNDSEEIMMKKKKRFYRIGPDGKRELVREEEIGGGKGVQNDHPGDDDHEQMMIRKVKRRYRIGPDGKHELIGTEDGQPDANHSEKTLLGTKSSSYSPDDQSNNDMDHEQIITKKKKKRTYRIGPDGKRELVGEEVIGGDQPSGEMSVAKKMRRIGKMFGENKNTYSPEPMNDLDNREDGRDASQNDQNDNSGMGMMTHKRKRFYEIGPDGKKKLVRTEGGGGEGTSEEEVIGTKKTKRFYTIGKDGKRTLLRTENSVADEKPAGTESDTVQPLKSDVDPPGKDTKLVLNRRGFFKGGHLSVPDESEESRDDENDKQGSKSMGKKAAQPVDDDGYEYEMKPRVKRTYVLDGEGNRKLVNEKTGDEKQDIDLGKLLRTRRKVVETETVDREHQERRFMKKKSVKSTRSALMNGDHTSPINKKKVMQKYHKDSSLRSGGKSEEDIPEEM